MNTILEIQNWFSQQCDGIWENSQRITIETCDNPAWWVRINLKDTKLENKSFNPVTKNVPQELVVQALGLIKPPFICASPTSENDWLTCYIKDEVFNGAGDPSKLEEILHIFLDWTK